MKTLALLFLAGLAVQPAVLQSSDLLNTAFLPQQQVITKTPAILRLQNDLGPDGTFTYTFETENGISAQAEGTMTRTADPEQSIQTIRGQYSYTGPDGVQYTVQYIADHNGFQAFGEHLPKPPPIPEEILRSLEHNAAHPEEDDGIVAASPALGPALAPTSAPQLLARTPLQPLAAAPLAGFNSAAASTRAALPKQQQQLAQTQLLAQTKVLQQQQLQAQQPQPLLINVQPQQTFQTQQQQFQAQQSQPQQTFQTQPQQFQTLQLQPQQTFQTQQQQFQTQQLQPQQLRTQQLQPEQVQAQQLQPQQVQLAQLQPQQVQLTQLQPQQVQLAQLQRQQQLQSQPQLQLTQLQPQQVQLAQLQRQQQLNSQPQLQPQDFLTQFAPSFQTFESQRRAKNV